MGGEIDPIAQLRLVENSLKSSLVTRNDIDIGYNITRNFEQQQAILEGSDQSLPLNGSGLNCPVNPLCHLMPSDILNADIERLIMGRYVTGLSYDKPSTVLVIIGS